MAARHHAAVARLGRLALTVPGLPELLNEAARIAADTLGVEFCKILELLPEREGLLLRAGVGWKEGLVGRAVVPASSETHAGQTLLRRGPVVIKDLRNEPGFHQSSLLHDHGVMSGASVVIPSAEPFGVIGVHTSRRRSFSRPEVVFLEAIAEVLAQAIQLQRTHEAVRQSEEQFRQTFEHAPIGMTLSGADHRLVRVNRAACDLLGYPVGELTGLTIEQITHPEDIPQVVELTEKLFRGEIPHFQCEKRTRTKSGESIPVHLTVAVIRDLEGNPTHAVGMIEDLTERLEKQRNLQLARHTIQLAQEGICWADASGKLTDANEAAARLLGFSRQELLSLTVPDVDLKATAEDWPQAWAKIKRQGWFTRESLFRAKGGRTLPVELTVCYMEFGGVELVCAFFRDVTERKRTEVALRKSEERYRDLFENAAAMVWTIDLDGNFTSVNCTGERFSGYGRDDLVGRNISVLLPQDQIQVARRMLERKIRENVTTTYELEILAKDGCHLPLQITSRLIRENGKPVGAQGIGINVTGRRVAEEKLRQSEERYRAIIETALDVITILDADGTVRYVSPSVERVLGYKVDEREGRSTFELVHPMDLPHVREAFARGLQSPGMTAQLAFRVRHKDGTWRHLEAVARNLLENRTVAGIVVNSRDVTQRKTAEEGLRLEHEFSQRLIETAQVIILVLDRKGRIVLYNTFLEELVGIRLEEVRGQDWFSIFVPLRIRRATRDVFESALGAHRTRGYVNLIVTKGGREREIEWYDAALTDASGQVSELLCIGHDVTERKRADETLRQSEAALRRSQKELRALAGRLIENVEAEHRRLARELHDDFNQRLTALAFGMAECEKEFPPEAAGHLTKLRRLQNEIAGLSDDMRLLAHQLHPAALELLGLPVALRQQCQESSHAGTLSVRFAARKLPGSIPREVALCLYRVAQESLRNATRHSEADRVSVTLCGVAGGIRLSITDNGAGFDPDEVQPRGGLGLISMMERVRIVGGALTIDSRPGRGTRVVAEVPFRSGN